MMQDKIGPTGNYPDGKLNGDDKGEIGIAITEHEGNVLILFGTPISWLALPPEQAEALAREIIKKAREIQ